MLVIPFLVYSQTTPGITEFNFLVSEASGDLNNDGLKDQVLVFQDTLAETAPYLLEIYFAKENGTKEKFISTETAILPDFPDGRAGLSSGGGFWEVVIEESVLVIRNELLRGNYNHRFRFKDGKFELIGFSYRESDGRGRFYSTEYDLITGILDKKTENYETDEVLEQSREIIKVSTFPSLLSFVPFAHRFF